MERIRSTCFPGNCRTDERICPLIPSPEETDHDQDDNWRRPPPAPARETKPETAEHNGANPESEDARFFVHHFEQCECIERGHAKELLGKRNALVQLRETD